MTRGERRAAALRAVVEAAQARTRRGLNREAARREAEAVTWPDAGEAWAAQSTATCDHGRLLWQSCRGCGVGAWVPPGGPGV